jgi:aspartate-semialdehyde dehydrogenase
MDDAANYIYATPIDAASKDDVFVSRMRKHPTTDEALSFWCVADNVRKGAALNAIQIAKKL